MDWHGSWHNLLAPLWPRRGRRRRPCSVAPEGGLWLAWLVSISIDCKAQLYWCMLNAKVTMLCYNYSWQSQGLPGHTGGSQPICHIIRLWDLIILLITIVIVEVSIVWGPHPHIRLHQLTSQGEFFGSSVTHVGVAHLNAAGLCLLGTNPQVHLASVQPKMTLHMHTCWLLTPFGQLVGVLPSFEASSFAGFL